MGIYTTNSAEACQYVAENCQANILVVENNKQLQKILQVIIVQKRSCDDLIHKSLYKHCSCFTDLLCSVMCAFQIQDKLPHLKAIIQYKDELKEKKPNLYTVHLIKQTSCVLRW